MNARYPSCTVALLAALGISRAQPVLNSDELLPINSYISWKNVFSPQTNIDTTIQGANVTWNFAGLIPTDLFSDFSVTVRAITDPVVGFSFSIPDANRVLTDNQSAAEWYYIHSPSQLELIGEGYSQAEPYYDRLVEHTFPLTMGTTSSDTWDSWDGQGTYSLRCIGYGTLILPSGTYTDVLFVRTLLNNSGSTARVYTWFSSTNGIPLLRYQDGEDFAYPDNARRILAFSVGLENFSLENGIICNNPIEEEMVLRFPTNGSANLLMEVYNASGDRVLYRNITVTAGQEVRTRTAALASGLYSVVIRDRDAASGSAVLKLVKL
jgi:hypothetical protein